MFIGNISWNLDWKQLKELFWEFGEVSFVRIITDRETWRSKGFGFVEFANNEDAAKARDAMDGKEIDGRALKVDFAEDRREA